VAVLLGLMVLVGVIVGVLVLVGVIVGVTLIDGVIVLVGVGVCDVSGSAGHFKVKSQTVSSSGP
jgi:hypothetical protein